MFVVILTGAGISAESGVATFRDPDGVWAKHDWRDVATPEAFAADPERVHNFYNPRRAALPGVEPNPAHLALARLEDELENRGDRFLLITQNVDDLHRRAGSRNVLQMHGALDRAACVHCGWQDDWTVDLSIRTPCPACKNTGCLRPAVVWFGEMPHHLDEIEQALGEATHFTAIGTSGTVYPAAGLAAGAAAAGAQSLLINLEPAENHSMFDRHIYGPAAEAVPQWVDALLAEQDPDKETP